MKHFSYGAPFLEINAQVLRRYAACAGEEEVREAEKRWLEKIEKEWNDSRNNNGGEQGDIWEGGNLNRREMIEDDSEDSEGEKQDVADEGDGGVTLPSYQPEIPASSDDNDEEEMIELRKRVLASKPFSNPSTDTKPQPERIPHPTGGARPEDSDAESDFADDSAFDNIINATSATDRTGIQAKQRPKGNTGKGISVSFSRTQVDAPKQR